MEEGKIAMKNQEIKIKVKIFCITFGILTLVTNYYEYRKKINEQTAIQQSIQNKSIEKSKADAALIAARETNKKAALENKTQIKTEQEYADIIKSNLEKNCKFWTNQYILSKRAEDKVDRDNACRLINKYFQ
jgi:predicted signal transduction protein with EAL and GGDEF domain